MNSSRTTGQFFTVPESMLKSSGTVWSVALYGRFFLIFFFYFYFFTCFVVAGHWVYCQWFHSQSCWTCSNKQMVYWDVDLCYNVRMNRELTFKVPLTVNSEFKAI